MVLVNVEGVGVVKIEDRPSIYHDLVGGKWVYNPERHWVFILDERDRRLKETNHSQFPDSPLFGKQSILEYRQALRELENTFENPEEVVWPELPEELK